MLTSPIRSLLFFRHAVRHLTTRGGGALGTAGGAGVGVGGELGGQRVKTPAAAMRAPPSSGAAADAPPAAHGSGDGDGWHSATVLRSTPLSPTVRGLALLVDDDDQGRRFAYDAGQWCDFEWLRAAPRAADPDAPDDSGFEGVGGFSMCAPPSSRAFREGRELELAVKRSRHPASAWVHDARCRPGARVRVRAGGRFTLGQANGCDAALFVAGGIGVTALAAMAGELVERWSREGEGEEGGGSGEGGPRNALFLYSTRARADLALLPQLREWAARSGGRLRLQVHVTGEEGVDEARPDGEGEAWRKGRVTARDAREAAQVLAVEEDGGAKVGAFVCGPPQMTDELAAALAEVGVVGPARVFTEKWW